jgi:hypothetical protein
MNELFGAIGTLPIQRYRAMPDSLGVWRGGYSPAEIVGALNPLTHVSKIAAETFCLRCTHCTTFDPALVKQKAQPSDELDTKLIDRSWLSDVSPGRLGVSKSRLAWCGPV